MVSNLLYPRHFGLDSSEGAKSFGFKYGLPLDADLVFDVRFLPNPYYKPELRNQTGLDKDVF